MRDTSLLVEAWGELQNSELRIDTLAVRDGTVKLSLAQAQALVDIAALDPELFALIGIPHYAQ